MESWDDYGGTLPWGSPSTSVSASTYGLSLKSIFIDPFVNATKAVGGELGKIGVRAVAALRTALESALSVLVPRFKADYDAIQRSQEKQLTKLKEAYASEWKAIDEAWDHPDVQLFSFLRSPTTWLSYRAITSKPQAALSVFDALVEGNRTLALFLRDIRNRLFGTQTPGQGVEMGAEKPLPVRGEGRLREAVPKKRQKTAAEQVADVLTSPGFLKAVRALPKVKEMQARASAVERTSSQALERAMRPVLSAGSAQDLSAASGGSWQPPKEYSELPDPARAQFDSELVGQAKASMAAYFSSRLQDLISQLQAAGVSDRSPYVASLRSTLSSLEPLTRHGGGGKHGEGSGGGGSAR